LSALGALAAPRSPATAGAPSGRCRDLAGRCAAPGYQSYLIELYALSFHKACSLLMERIVPDRERITSEWVVAPPGRYLTPSSSSPSVIPVAAKNTSSEETRSS